MKHLRIPLAVLVLVLTLLPARALMIRYERQPVNCSGWSQGLADLVNHPARVGGQLGPFGCTGTFWYAGDQNVLNGVIAQYSRLTGTNETSGTVNLSTMPAEGGISVAVSIDGSVTLTVHCAGPDDLAGLKVPVSLTVVRLDAGTVLPPRKDGEALDRAIRRFVKQHAKKQARLPKTSPAPPSAEFEFPRLPGSEPAADSKRRPE